MLQGEVMGDAARERFPLKLRDLAVAVSFDLLKKRSLINDESSEVDMGAMAQENNIEW
jgi:hypothetical protein